MQCPVCSVPLSISAREGVEIDFCPQCRGVWLDRGELDKIIDRVAATQAAPAVGGFDAPSPPPPPAAAPADDRPRPDGYRDDRRYDDRGYDDRDRRRKKRRSFLEDIFDFD